MSSNRRLAFLVHGVALVALLSGPAHADNDDRGKRALLVVQPTQTGGTLAMTLRSTLLGQPAAFLVSGGNGPLPGPGHAVLHLDPVFLILKIGFIGPAGKMSLVASVPPNPTILDFHAQALVIPPSGPMLASNPVPVRIDASGAASFSEVTGTHLPAISGTTFSTDADAVDLEADGDTDLVVASTSGVLVYVNDGTGHFSEEGSTRLDFNLLAECLEFGDVDGDGDPDLFVSGATPSGGGPNGLNRLFLNDGQGFFTRDPAFPTGLGVSQDAEFGDVDNDGDLDLLLANLRDQFFLSEDPDPDLLMINQGGAQAGVPGTFVADPAFSQAAFNDFNFVTVDATLGDIDDDGDLDVFLARADLQVGRTNVLLRNDGALGFVDVSSTQLSPLYLDDTMEAEMADVDGDGDLDLLIAQSLPSVFGATLMRNQGGGFFVEDQAAFPQLIAEGELIRLGLDVADIENDGDMDVLFSVHFELDGVGGMVGQSLLFLNRGGVQGGTQGTFELDTTFPMIGPFIAPDALFADIDHDGNMDVFITSFGDFFGGAPQDRLLLNDL